MKSINTYYTSIEELKLFIDNEKIQKSSSLLIQIFSTSTDKTSISALLLELTKLLPHAVTTVSTTNNQMIDKNVSSKKIVITFTQFKEIQLKKVDIPHTSHAYDSSHYLSKERMELALLGNTDGVWDWNILENTLYLSPRWKEILGYRDEELNNELLTWESRLHPDDIDMVWIDIQKHIDRKTEYYENIHRLKHKEGYWVWILARGKAQFNEQVNAIRMIGTHTDITEEKKKKLTLQHQAQMIEQTHEAINTTDLKGYIISWNRGSELLFGYKADEVIGKHISFLYEKSEYVKFAKHIPTLIKDGEYRSVISLIKNTKETIFVDLSLSLLRDEKNIPIGIVGYLKDITERKHAEDDLLIQKNILRYQAHYDALTGLPNRVFFFDQLKEEIEKVQNNKTKLALFFIDLDKFKDINDSLGHSMGDNVLKSIAKRLKSIIRKGDTLARLSGDEFTVIMEDLKKSEDAELLVKKILKSLAEPLYIDDQILYLSGSIGISLYPQDATDAELLLKYADTAMYKAKEEGRNNFQFYSHEMTELALERIKMKTELRQAIDNKEFVIYYQPQINAATQTLIGMEALIRWKHPTKGLILPDEFIPLAEETGLIVEIDQWVMKTAMNNISKWYKAELNPGVLALNLSIRQLEKLNCVSKIENSMEIYDFNSDWLELEVTEGQMIKKPKDIIEKLNHINQLGIAISIDDFGTGYSSLSLLKRLPIHRLKIDRSFISDIPNNQEDVAIVKTIISLAENLSLDLIAEGVENGEQRSFLMEQGCINMQGYYYSKPVPADEMQKMLIKNSWQY